MCVCVCVCVCVGGSLDAAARQAPREKAPADHEPGDVACAPSLLYVFISLVCIHLSYMYSSLLYVFISLICIHLSYEPGDVACAPSL